MGSIVLCSNLLPLVSKSLGVLLLSTPTPSSSLSPDASLGFIGAVATALLAGFFGWRYIHYTVQKTRELEQEKQKNENLQRRLDQLEQYRQLEDEFVRKQDEEWRSARREAQEQEKQRKAQAQTAVRTIMGQAHTPAQQEEAYRQALHADANISQLQILDMAHPMEVANVYVRLRLHTEHRLRYEVFFII